MIASYFGSINFISFSIGGHKAYCLLLACAVGERDKVPHTFNILIKNDWFDKVFLSFSQIISSKNELILMLENR